MVRPYKAGISKDSVESGKHSFYYVKVVWVQTHFSEVAHGNRLPGVSPW